jgi:hypothetical protein
MTRVSAVVAPLLAIVVAVLLVALPSSTQAAASASRGTATGIGVRVLNEAGKLVPGAHVGLVNADGKIVAHRETNKFGRCVFHPVKPGDYKVRAFRLGQGKGQEAVSVEDGGHAKVTVHLKKQ